jgi:mono/diheme cytochrome c family protein
MRSLRAATAAVLAIASVAAAASGPALDYTLNCEGCHRADGTGTPGSVPALRDSVARFLAAPGGREYLARVPGVAQAPLDDAALAAVLNWLLEHFDHAHVPSGFAPYSADEVGQLRKQPLVDVEGTRTRLLGESARNGVP